MTSDDLVTIASFPNPIEAHIAKGKLESEGIDSYVANDTLFSINPGYVWADGGVHLRVRESDAPRALRILSGQD